MSVRIAWRFYDPELDEEYFWPVNPNADNSSNAVQKNISYSARSALRRNSDDVDVASTVIFQRNIEQQQFNYSGLLYTQAQLDDLKDWCTRPYRLYLTDDLQRTWEVYVNKFSTSRVRARHSPYKHAYTFGGIILAEVT